MAGNGECQVTPAGNRPGRPPVRRFAAPLLAMAVFAVLFREVCFLGHGLTPVDGALTSYPWRGERRQNYLLADQAKTFLPAREFQYQQARQGRFPRWNPYLACGVPFAAAIQYAVYYPPNLLYLLLSPFHAAGLVALVKLVLAAAFMRLYLRQLGLGEAVACFGGVCFAYCGFNVTWLGHPHTNASVFLPLILYALQREIELAPAWTRVRLRNLGLLTIGVACVLLGGHPPTAVHVGAMAGAYGLGFGLSHGTGSTPPGRHRCGVAAGLAICLLGALLLTAIQVVPYLEYHVRSSTAASSARLNRAAAHLSPGAIVNLVLPSAAGNPVHGHEALREVWRLRVADYHLDRNAYVGMAVWFLAVLSLLARSRDRVVRFHAAVVLVAMAVVYGLPPFPWLLPRLPLLSQINPVRLTLLIDFSLISLAAIGFSLLLRGEASACVPRAVALVWLGLGGLLAGLGLTGQIDLDALRHARGPDQAYLAVQASTCLLFAAGISAVLACHRRLPRAVALAVIFAIETAELLHWGRGYNPSIPPQLYWPRTPALDYLAQDSTAHRVLGLGYVLPPNSALPYGIQDVRGVDYMTVRRYEELVTGRAGDFWFCSVAGAVPPPVQLLNAKYFATRPEVEPEPPELFELVYDGEIRIYRFRLCRPRAFVVGRAEQLEDQALLERVRQPTFDPTQVVLFEASDGAEPGPARPAAQGAAAPAAPAQATVGRYLPDEVEVSGRSATGGFLVLLDTHFPGWTATVNGVRATVRRADYCFRAVRVPAGDFRVVFRYRPLSFRIGRLLSGLGTVLLVVLLAGRWPRSTAER